MRQQARAYLGRRVWGQRVCHGSQIRRAWHGGCGRLVRSLAGSAVGDQAVCQAAAAQLLDGWQRRCVHMASVRHTPWLQVRLRPCTKPCLMHQSVQCLLVQII